MYSIILDAIFFKESLKYQQKQNEEILKLVFIKNFNELFP